MRYYKMTDAEGKLTAIGTGSGGTEITAGEYTALSAEITEKAALVAALADGRISAENIREDWREEIVRRAETEDEQNHSYTEADLAAMTNAELERILATYGLTATANKSNMIRLILYMQGGGADA